MTERRIISFNQFTTNKGKIVKEDTLLPPDNGGGSPDSEDGGSEGGGSHYMFFKNLLAIKHYVDEILAMNPEELENLLKNGHDWAADHIATSKDDIQEVTDWARGEIEMGGHSDREEPEVPIDLEPDGQIEVEVDDEQPGEEEPGEEEPDEEEVEVEEEPDEEESDEEGEDIDLGGEEEDEEEEGPAEEEPEEEVEDIEIESPSEERRKETD